MTSCSICVVANDSISESILRTTVLDQASFLSKIKLYNKTARDPVLKREENLRTLVLVLESTFRQNLAAVLFI